MANNTPYDWIGNTSTINSTLININASLTNSSENGTIIDGYEVDYENFSYDVFMDYYDISYRVATFFNAPIILVLILGFVATVANMCTIVAVAQVRSKWTGLFRFMLSLMVSDIVVAVSAMLFVLNRVFNPQYMAGYGPYGARVKAKCASVIIKALNTTGLNITLLNLMGMAIDHYVAILSPLQYYRILSTRKTNTFICILWIIAFLSGFSDFYSPLWDLTTFKKFQKSYNYCEYIEKSSYSEEYTTFAIAISCYIVMLNVYLKIYCNVKKMRRGAVVVGGERRNSTVHKRRKSSSESSMFYSNNGDADFNNYKDSNQKNSNKNNKLSSDDQKNPFISGIQQSGNRKWKNKKRNTRALYTTLLIIGTFMICWLPLCCFQISMLIIKKIHKDIPDVHITRLLKADQYLYVVLLLNTICDPIIYAVRIGEVRRGFKTLVCRIFKCKKSASILQRRASTFSTITEAGFSSTSKYHQSNSNNFKSELHNEDVFHNNVEFTVNAESPLKKDQEPRYVLI